MPIKLQGATSGAVTITAPAVAANNTITLPVSDGTLVVADNSGSLISNGLRSIAGSNLSLGSGTTVTATFDTSGNVGIGTTSPGTKLHVFGNNGTYGLSSFFSLNGSTPGVGIGNTGSLGLIQGLTTATGTVTDLLIQPNGGNVGIGTTSPSTKLTVAKPSIASFTGAAFGTAALIDPNSTLNNFTNLDFITSSVGAPIARIGMQYTSGGSSLNFGTSNNYGLGVTNTAMTIDPTGNVAIGTTSGGVKFTVASTGIADTALLRQNGASGGTSQTAIGFQNAASTYVGTIQCNGTATAYNTTSDYRLKENVRPMIIGLKTIGALKPVNYDWISDKSQGEGFIAHELQAVIPHAVTGEKDAVNKDGSIKPQGVDYSKIVVHLVAAIKELEARLAVLEAKK